MCIGKVGEALQSLNEKEPNKTLHYVKCKSLFTNLISMFNQYQITKMISEQKHLSLLSLIVIYFFLQCTRSKKNFLMERTKFSIEVFSV